MAENPGREEPCGLNAYGNPVLAAALFTIPLNDGGIPDLDIASP